REALALEYLAWAQLFEEENRFDNEKGYVSAMGGAFKGLETDFASVERVCDWGEESRTNLARFGALGKDICRQLFSCSSDALGGLVALAGQPKFQEFTQIVLDPAISDSATLQELINDSEQGCSELASVLSTLGLLTFSADLPLSQVA